MEDIVNKSKCTMARKTQRNIEHPTMLEIQIIKSVDNIVSHLCLDTVISKT